LKNRSPYDGISCADSRRRIDERLESRGRRSIAQQYLQKTGVCPSEGLKQTHLFAIARCDADANLDGPKTSDSLVKFFAFQRQAMMVLNCFANIKMSCNTLTIVRLYDFALLSFLRVVCKSAANNYAFTVF
jgi:hypothetical protein